MPSEKDSPFSSLAEALERRVLELLEKGWKFPIYGAAMDEFGDFTAWRFVIGSAGGVKCHPVTEHLEPGRMMIAPFSIVLLDGMPGHVDPLLFGMPPRPAN